MNMFNRLIFRIDGSFNSFFWSKIRMIFANFKVNALQNLKFENVRAEQNLQFYACASSNYVLSFATVFIFFIFLLIFLFSQFRFISSTSFRRECISNRVDFRALKEKFLSFFRISNWILYAKNLHTSQNVISIYILCFYKKDIREY